jgi:Tol biopolymer transport system component
MSLAVGTRLGTYAVTAKLGEGGMGQVWKAKDFRLGREVALKVLPEGFTSDPDRLARFEREAKLLAQLNHPNIAQIYGMEASGETRALVMELVDGPTLADRLEAGALPFDESLSFALQIAQALEEAHEKGIVHRDLKPQNIKASMAGRVKVLDFGLAKAMDPSGGAVLSGSALANSPTVTFGGTREGVILGTAAYMAPEQARGVAVDKRADIWAFGVVLFEMIAGGRLFAAESVVDTLSAVMRKEIDYGALPASTPVAMRDLLRRCLERNPKSRLHDIADARIVLEEIERRSADSSPAAAAPARSPRASRALAWALGAALAAVVGLAALLVSGRGGVEAPRGSVPSVESFVPLTVDPGYEGEASVAPDGETIAYVADRSGQFEIYLQQAGGGPAIDLTHHPADDVQPAISPDGRQLVFVSTRESRLELAYRSPGYPLMGGDVWVVSLLGGPPRKVAEDGNFPTWSPDGRTIYFSRGLDYRSELRRVAATGGESAIVPVELPAGNRPVFLFDPDLSPDGRWLLFCSAETVFVAPVEGGPAAAVANGRFATWEPAGEAIVYSSTVPGHNGGLWRVPFAARSGEAAATAQPFLLGPAPLERPAFARDGRRIVVTALEREANLEVLPLDSESGRVGTDLQVLTTGGHDISFFTASPDGGSIVFEDRRGAASHLWRLDEGGEPVRMTDDPDFAESFPRWSPDGRVIAFSRRPAQAPRIGSNSELGLMAPDGGGQRRLTAEGGYMAWLPSSRELIYLHRGDFHRIDAATAATRKIAIEGPASMPIFVVSPDGEWLVYQTAEGGDVDLVLVPVAGGRARAAVRSPRHDHHPSFSGSGQWLYYQPDHRNLWRVPGPAQGWREAPPQRVTSFPESGLVLEDPQVSAGSGRLFYSRIRTGGDLWIAELGGAASRARAAEDAASR